MQQQPFLRNISSSTESGLGLVDLWKAVLKHVDCEIPEDGISGPRDWGRGRALKHNETHSPRLYLIHLGH
jgi:hypothetical protein